MVILLTGSYRGLVLAQLPLLVATARVDLASLSQQQGVFGPTRYVSDGFPRDVLVPLRRGDDVLLYATETELTV